MASLRDIKEFITDIEGRDPEGRTLTQGDIADILQSLAKVGGVMSFRNQTPTVQPVSAGWFRLDAFDNSNDTQGVQDGIGAATDPGGYFTVKNNADGDYTCTAMIRFISDTDGFYELRVSSASLVEGAYVTQQSPFHDGMDVVAGETNVLVIASALIKNVARTDRLFLEMRGPNPANATALFAQFGVQR
jgi:hypothetical protein